MSESQHSNQEANKPALLTAKEKKVAKQARKHAGDAIPFALKAS